MDLLDLEIEHAVTRHREGNRRSTGVPQPSVGSPVDVETADSRGLHGDGIHPDDVDP